MKPEWCKQKNFEKAKEVLPILDGMSLADAQEVLDIIRMVFLSRATVDAKKIAILQASDDGSNPPHGPGTPP